MLIENDYYIYEFNGISERGFGWEDLLFLFIEKKNKEDYSLRVVRSNISEEYSCSEEDFYETLIRLSNNIIRISGKKDDYYLELNYILFFERSEDTYNIALNKLAVDYIEKARDQECFLATKSILDMLNPYRV